MKILNLIKRVWKEYKKEEELREFNQFCDKYSKEGFSGCEVKLDKKPLEIMFLTQGEDGKWVRVIVEDEKSLVVKKGKKGMTGAVIQEVAKKSDV